jgi:hypothetical protein
MIANPAKADLVHVIFFNTQIKCSAETNIIVCWKTNLLHLQKTFENGVLN